MSRLSIHTYRYEVTLPPLPTSVTLKVSHNWQVIVTLFSWSRARWDYPTHWRTIPTMTGPIFRQWSFGPVHVRRFRVI